MDGSESSGRRGRHCCAADAAGRGAVCAAGGAVGEREGEASAGGEGPGAIRAG